MMFRPARRTTALLLLTVLALGVAGAEGEKEPQAPTIERDRVLTNLEEIVRSGELPGYEALRLPAEDSRAVEERFLMTVPLLRGDVATSDVVFADVPTNTRYSLLGLSDLVGIALESNFDLVNSARGLEIAASETTGAEAFFLPFVDAVGSGRLSYNRDESVPAVGPQSGTTTRSTLTDTVSAGLEARQNLPTGGSLTADVTESKTRTRTSDGLGDGKGTGYDADANARLTQPLLRGSGLLTGDGTEIGTADLRASRLSELDTILGNRLSQRNTVRQVIRQYFTVLQIKQQLLVSRDAIQERYRFLDETRVKYEVGRVAESEILRAQIQFLQEVETAINRQQQLDDAREDLLILLGLPLETPISLVDLTPMLRDRGRFEIPDLEEALSLGMTNRVELMRSDLAVQQSEISQRVARNETLPDLDFDTGYGRRDDGRFFGDANEFDDSEFDAGMTLRIPLQNVQRREAHRRANLRLEQSKTDRESLRRDLTQEIRAAHRQVLTTEARLTVLRKQVEQARRNLELINGSFEVGFTTVTEVRLAQDDLFNAETAYSNAVLSYQIGIADLYVAMGLPLY